MSPSLHFCLEVKREIQVRCAREVCKTIAVKDTRAYGVLSSDLGAGIQTWSVRFGMPFTHRNTL